MMIFRIRDLSLSSAFGFAVAFVSAVPVQRALYLPVLLNSSAASADSALKVLLLLFQPKIFLRLNSVSPCLRG
jgi:hypothetical protein